MFDSQVKRKVSQKDQEDSTNMTDQAMSTKETSTKGTQVLTPKKSQSIPVPPLLSIAKNSISQSDKINQNNKIIQDILNGNKKQSSLYNSQRGNETKFQSHQFQKLASSNPSSKLKAEIQNDINEQTETQELVNRRQSLQFQKDDTVTLPRKFTQGQVQKSKLYNTQYQDASNLATLPIDSQRQLNKSYQTPNKQRIDSTQSTPKTNSQAMPQININSKVKDNEYQFSSYSLNPSNTQYTNNLSTLSSYLKNDEIYKNKPISQSQTSRKSLCGSEIYVTKNSRDVQTRDKSFSSFRINDKICITQRNSLSNQGSGLTTNQRLVSSSQNLRRESQQQDFFSSFIPTDNTEGSSKPASTYYSLSTRTFSPQIQKTERETKQITIKPSNMVKVANEYGNQFINSTSILGTQSQNSFRLKQITVNQLDQSLAINGIETQTEYGQTFKNVNQNVLQCDQIVANNGIIPNEQKKFAQSFSMLTKIVNQNTPEKNPNNSINMTKKYQVEDKLIKGMVHDRFQIQDDLLSTAQYEISLKKEVPSAFSDAPSTRSDVITMQKWLQNQLNQIQKMNSSKKVLHLSSVIELSCKELLRQISVECQERGELLQTVIYNKLHNLQLQNEIF